MTEEARKQAARRPRRRSTTTPSQATEVTKTVSKPATTAKTAAPKRSASKASTSASASSKPASSKPASSKPASATGPAKPTTPGTATAKRTTAAVARSSDTAAPEPAGPVPAAPAPPSPFALFVVRHADAGDPAEWAGDDADRPLSKKGRRQAKRLASFLAGIGVEADALVTSPKVRAADTAKALAKRLKVTTTVDPRLGFGFDGSSLDDVISGLPPEATSVLLVGHDPDLSGLVSWLVGAPLALRKGALAVVDLPDRSTGPGRGTLRWLLPPDAIPD